MAVTASLIPTLQAHIEHVAERVRDADRREIWASHYMTPLEGLRWGLEESTHITTGCADGEPVVIYGVARGSYVPDLGVPWMIASSRLDEPDVAIRFLRQCREPLVAFLEDYAILTNHVDARNTRAIKWLQYMGFDVEQEAKPYGAQGLPFHRFTMMRG